MGTWALGRAFAFRAGVLVTWVHRGSKTCTQRDLLDCRVGILCRSLNRTVDSRSHRPPHTPFHLHLSYTSSRWSLFPTAVHVYTYIRTLRRRASIVACSPRLAFSHVFSIVFDSCLFVLVQFLSVALMGLDFTTVTICNCRKI